MSHASSASILLSMFSRVKKLGNLYVESLRLKSTEKITIILAAVAYYAVAMALALVCLVFISIGIGHLLATTTAPHVAYLLIAAFYLILLVLVILWRRQIFIDPIARFISRVLVEMPEEERQKETSRRNAALADIVARAERMQAEDLSDADNKDNGLTVTGSAAHDNDTVILEYKEDPDNERQ